MRRACYMPRAPGQGFRPYVEEVRTTHKAKRNLTKLMAGLGPVRTA
jgi:hypothetical protein